MKIGIVSDTHSRTALLKSALNLLTARGAERIVHCGDLGSGDCLALLATAGVPAAAVAGNMDRRIPRLAETAQRCGVRFSPGFIEVAFGDGQHLVATHGHNQALLDELILGGQFPYVCHGHTHRMRDETLGTVRVINPGALRHPRGTRHHTVALLDTDTDDLEFLRIDR